MLGIKVAGLTIIAGDKQASLMVGFDGAGRSKNLIVLKGDF